MTAQADATIEFRDSRGKSKGTLRIVPQKGSPLNLLPLAKARELGEEPVQIFEGGSYEYEAFVKGDGTEILPNQIIQTSSLASPGCLRGRLTPKNFVGRLPIQLIASSGQVFATGAVEVCSVKLSYRQEYRWMLQSIAEKCIDLVIRLRGPVEARLTPLRTKDLPSLQQRFFFLRALIGGSAFADAIGQILRSPHSAVVDMEETRDLSRALRFGKSIHSQLASARNRSILPSTHPLAKAMNRRGITCPSIPSRITCPHRTLVFDTPENRAIKYILESFDTLLAQMGHLLQQDGPDGQAFAEREVFQLRERVKDWLSRDLFKQVPSSPVLPTQSPVLQGRPGYREAFQSWLRFQLAASMTWPGGEDVFGANKKEVGALYEYWVFFELLALLGDHFDFSESIDKELLESRKDGLGLKLKSGKALVLDGSWGPEGRRGLNVRFSYNREFNRKGADPERNYPLPGSWTRAMRPDFTVSAWPKTFSAEEAELQELMVHLHFDAKYRVEDLAALFGSDRLDHDMQKSHARQGRHERADLLVMHAYRDAIRRTEGAYIIYPGEQSVKWRVYHEVIPGVGAFVLRPGPRTTTGTSELADHIARVLEHLSDRATRREEQAYERFRIQTRDHSGPVLKDIPEVLSDGTTRTLPPTQHNVLLAPHGGIRHIRWILGRGLCDVFLGEEGLDRGAFTPQHLLLLSPEGHPMHGLLRVASPRAWVVTGKDLTDMGHPCVSFPDRPYILFEVSPDPDFDRHRWAKKWRPVGCGIVLSPFPPIIRSLADLLHKPECLDA